MNDTNPIPEGPSPTGLPPGNEASLDIRDSQVDKIIQVVGSHNVTVNEAPKTVTQVQSGANSAAIIIGGLALLTAQAFLPTGRSNGGINVLVGGGALAMILFGFFSWVESLLKSDFMMEIARWLSGVEVGKKVDPWPETFATMHLALFGMT